MSQHPHIPARPKKAELGAVLDALGDAVYLHDFDGQIDQVNQASCDELGYSREEFQALKVTDIDVTAAEVGVTKMRERWEKSLASERTFRFEGRHRRRDGSTFPVDVRARFLKHEGKRLVLAIARNIEPILRQAAETRRLQEQFEQFLTHTPGYAYIKDEQGRFVLTNQRFETDYGFSPGGLIGKSTADILPRETAEPIMANDRLVLASGKADVFEESANERVLLSHKFPIPQPDGGSHLGGVSIDITTRKHAERQLAQQLDFEKLLAEVSAAFISPNPKAFDQEIVNCLGRVGEYLNVDYAALGRFTDDFTALRYDHEWTAPGVAHIDEKFKFVELKSVPWAEEQLRDSKPVVLSNMEDIPVAAKADRRFFKELGVKSHLSFPLTVGGELLGAVSFDLFREPHEWPADLVERLQVIVNVFGSALERRRADIALGQSERLRDEILNAVPIVVFVKDLDGRHLLVNDHYEKVVGIPRSRVIGRTDAEIFPADVARKIREVDEQVIREGRLLTFEETVPVADGVRDYLSNKAPLFDTEGKPFGLCSWAVDITERKQRERMLQATNLVANIGGWDLDLETNTLSWSEQTYRIHEVPADYQPDIDAAIDFYAPEARPVIRKAVDKAIATGEPWDLELPFVTAKGRHIWVRAQGQAVKRDGKPVRLHGAFQDITARKEAENELRANEQRFRAMFEQAAVGVAEVGPDLRFRRINPAFCNLLGRTEAELIGMPFRDVTHPEDQVAGIRRVKALLNGEIDQFSVDKRYLHKDGHTIFGSVNVSLVRNSNGEPDYFIAVVEDTTERRHIEQHLRTTQRLESIGQLAKGVANDLNNVLSHVTMGLDLLEGEEKDPEKIATIRSMQNDARRGGKAIRDILTFSGAPEGGRMVVEMNDLVANLTHTIRETFPPNIRVNDTPESDLAAVHGDPAQLRQALMNLCLNAREAMPDGGTLRLTGNMRNLEQDDLRAHPHADPGRYISIEVEDTGLGISSDVHDRIFEPFFTTHRESWHAGLGLSTTLGIIRGHGGFIETSSEPGRGASFTVYLPVYSPKKEDELPAEQPLPTGNGETILVVDDEPGVLDTCSRMLARFGYHTLTAEDGVNAVDIYAGNQSKIDLVLTDIVMPLMDGVALVRTLQKLNPSVRIVATSGQAEVRDDLESRQRQQLSSLGVDAFVSKPFSKKELLSVIADTLNKQ